MAKKLDWQGTPVYSIENEELAVFLVPSLGNNLYRIWDKKAQRDVLRTPEGPQELAEAPGQFGTPLMMPPNRIRHGRFTYGEREYQFDLNSGNLHHIHGFLRGVPWRFDEAASDSRTLVSVWRQAEYPDVARQYPHDLEIVITYTLEGASLKQTTSILNHGEEAAPFGYGLHTWFMLDGRPEEWTLTLPVESVWDLTPDCLPTGALLPLGPYADITTGMSLKGANLDHVFQIGDNNPCLAVLRRDGYELRYSAPEGFRQWVIFTKGEADQWVCLEPYTWVTDAPNLELPPNVTGLQAVSPGETVRLDVLLELIR